MIMKQSYFIESSTHSTFGMCSFIMQCFHKVIHSMHDYIEKAFNDSTNLIMHISLIKNYLNFVNVKIILPSNKIYADMLYPEFHIV